MRGPDGLNRFAATYRCAFLDLAMNVRDQLAEGDLVGTRFVARGTHRGAPMGIPPPGNRMKIGAFTLRRFSGRKITAD